jgi:hypothetical protein
MNEKFFTTIIILMGLFTAYLFYALWHSETLDQTPNEEPKVQDSNQITEDLSNKKIIPRKQLVVPEGPAQVSVTTIEDKDVQAIIETHKSIVFQSPQLFQEKTEEVYSQLRPDEHDEIMNEANEAFSRLDEQIITYEPEEDVLEESIESMGEGDSGIENIEESSISEETIIQ